MQFRIVAALLLSILAVVYCDDAAAVPTVAPSVAPGASDATVPTVDPKSPATEPAHSSIPPAVETTTTKASPSTVLTYSAISTIIFMFLSR